jgi:hypothetical protein
MKTTSAGGNPNPIRLYYSKARAAVVLVLLTACVTWVGYLALAGLLTGHVVLLLSSLLMLAVVVPLAIAFARESARALTHRGPVVIMDARGITDTRQKVPFVAWDDVGELSLGGLSQTRGYLIFEFRTASTARARTPSFFLARFFVRKLLFLGDWHVDLRPLQCRPADVLRAARTLRQQAIRLQVVRLNAGRPDGWSGTL